MARSTRLKPSGDATTPEPKTEGRPSRILNTRKVLNKAAEVKMQQNAQQSPLLRLPPELRNRIFRLVFGDRNIHISTDGYQVKYWELVSSVCCATMTDREFASAVRAAPEGVVFEKYTVRHCDCEAASTPSEKQIEHLSLALLQCCRQIHREAALVPYQTNNFTFESAYELHKFLAGRLMVPGHVRAIAHITVHIGGGFFLSKVDAKMLSGLKCLTLLAKVRSVYLANINSGSAMDILDLADLKQLPIMPLKSVIIALYDHPPSPPPQPQSGGWTGGQELIEIVAPTDQWKILASAAEKMLTT